MDINDFRPKWIGVAMDDMTSFFTFCIKNECRELSHEEFASWADRIGYITAERDKTYRLKTVFPVCKSIYEAGFDYKYLPNVIEEDRIVGGRHRVCIANALGAIQIPVVNVSTLEDTYVSEEEVSQFFSSVSGTIYQRSSSYQRLAGKSYVS